MALAFHLEPPLVLRLGSEAEVLRRPALQEDVANMMVSLLSGGSVYYFQTTPHPRAFAQAVSQPVMFAPYF